MFILKQQQSRLVGSRHCRLPEATLMKLLHIDSSALGANSASRELSAAIVARWRADVPGLSVQYRDLDSDPLPHLDGNGLTKARSEEHTSELQSLMRPSYAVSCLKK